MTKEDIPCIGFFVTLFTAFICAIVIFVYGYESDQAVIAYLVIIACVWLGAGFAADEIY